MANGRRQIPRRTLVTTDAVPHSCVCLLLLNFPEARRAASSICAMPKTRTIAAIVAVSFAGSVTVGRGGHLINIAAGVSGRWTSSISSRSDWVTAPTARNRSESLDTELSTGPTIPMASVSHTADILSLDAREATKSFEVALLAAHSWCSQRFASAVAADLPAARPRPSPAYR